jgi:hypothetical protein
LSLREEEPLDERERSTKHKALSSKPSGIAATAKAFATYSLVPYLGILFCPGAMLVGGFGVLRSYRSRTADDSTRSVCYVSAIVGFLVLVIQLFLWWILYKAPIWAKGM